MTVQSHNYLLDSLSEHNKPSTSSPNHPSTSSRVIQFPIIQVNSNNHRNHLDNDNEVG